jgi:O-methyltransferase
VLILDDYGEWEGARLATDEFLAEQGTELLLVRVSGARIAVKP